MWRRSKLTITGNSPYDGGTSPENLLYDRFRVPATWVRLPMPSGKVPLSRFEDRSKWVRFWREEICGGMGPDRELRERSRERRLGELKRWEGMRLEKLLLERERCWRERMAPSSDGR